MKTIKLLTLLSFSLLVLPILFISCSNDDDNSNQAPILENKVLDVSENLTSDLVTTFIATDVESDSLTYSIVSQTPANSVTIGEFTGEIFVNNPDAFDYEQNTKIEIVVSVSDGNNITEATLTINIIDVIENG